MTTATQAQAAMWRLSATIQKQGLHELASDLNIVSGFIWQNGGDEADMGSIGKLDSILCEDDREWCSIHGIEWDAGVHGDCPACESSLSPRRPE